MLGAMFFVIRQAEPLMHDQHAGPLPGNGIIVGEITFERRVALFVFDGLGHNFGLCGNRAGQREQKQDGIFHNHQP